MLNESDLIGNEITYLRPKQSRWRGAIEIAIWLFVIAAFGIAIYGFAITSAPIK